MTVMAATKVVTRMRFDPYSRSMGWLQATVCAFVLVCACNGEKDLSFEAKENTPCQNCDDCTGFGGSCLCVSCASHAFDHETNTLLLCADGAWRKLADCPGGGEAGCTEGPGASFRFTCVDEDGDEVSINN